MLLKDVMKDIIYMPHDATITEVAQVMENQNIGSVPIKKYGEIIGIITERDILKKIVAKEKLPGLTKANDIITSNLITLDVEDDILKANEVMQKNNIRRLLITQDDKIVGIITLRDVSRNLRYALAQRVLRPKESNLIRNIF